MNINGPQSVGLGKESIKFKNYFKQIPVPFKIYANFECNLKSVESCEGFYSNKYWQSSNKLMVNINEH